MPRVNKKASEPRRISASVPRKLTQQQILYSLLLVAVFLIGYLIATVQALRPGAQKAVGTETVGNTQPQNQQQAPSAPDPQEVKKNLGLGTFPVKGDKNAKVTIVEFSDFECPFCAAFFKDTLPQLTKDYIDTGKVKMYYRHYPLDFHPKAKPLANAAECANEQGKFWEMHDRIFTENSGGTLASATDDTYKQWAVELGLSADQFNSCYDAKKYEANITKDSADGQKFSVSGTPTFYINGVQLVGAQPYQNFKSVIEAELAK